MSMGNIVKLMGVAVAVGAGAGIWLNGLIKDKINGVSKGNKVNVRTVVIPDDANPNEVTLVYKKKKQNSED